MKPQPNDLANVLRRPVESAKKSGELIHVEIVSFNLEFNGKPARLGVVTDITERLKEQERAREIEERYQSLLKGAKDA